MKVFVRERLVLIELGKMTPDELEDFHNFLRDSMISPIKKVEVVKNGYDAREAYYSACFTEEQAETIRGWLESKEISVNQSF